jgi:hypothetical protein
MKETLRAGCVADLLIYFPVVIIFIGFLTANRWMIWAGVSLLILMYTCIAVLGVWGGIKIPMEIFRNWTSYGFVQKVFFGPAALFCFAGAVFSVLALVWLLWRHWSP